MSDENKYQKNDEKYQGSDPEVAEKTRLTGYYKEINDYRRHYSQLRFALFPIYLTTQYGLIRIGFQPLSVSFCMPAEILLGLAGIFITYVFWTIERRIISYYMYLKKMGSELESGLGCRLISEWPQEANQSFIRNTELSINITFIVAIIFWLSTICSYIFNYKLL